jgi:multidrug resistance efflux pump
MMRQAEHAQAQADYDDVTDQIRKLGDLRDEGVISDEEFETKKRELLARL